MHAYAGLGIGLEGGDDQGGSQVGAADADVDHVGNAFAAVSQPASTVHGLDKRVHLPEHLMHRPACIQPIHLQSALLRVAQCRMQGSPVLGKVEFLALEQGSDLVGQFGLGSQLDQQVQRVIGDDVLGIIEQDAAGLLREPVKALDVIVEQGAHGRPADAAAVELERLPGGKGSQGIGHGAIPSMVRSCSMRISLVKTEFKSSTTRLQRTRRAVSITARRL